MDDHAIGYPISLTDKHREALKRIAKKSNRTIRGVLREWIRQSTEETASPTMVTAYRMKVDANEPSTLYCIRISLIERDELKGIAYRNGRTVVGQIREWIETTEA